VTGIHGGSVPDPPSPATRLVSKPSRRPVPEIDTTPVAWVHRKRPPADRDGASAGRAGCGGHRAADRAAATAARAARDGDPRVVADRRPATAGAGGHTHDPGAATCGSTRARRVEHSTTQRDRSFACESRASRDPTRPRSGRDRIPGSGRSDHRIDDWRGRGRWPARPAPEP
jgi:hypothetical protein